MRPEGLWQNLRTGQGGKEKPQPSKLYPALQHPINPNQGKRNTYNAFMTNVPRLKQGVREDEDSLKTK